MKVIENAQGRITVGQASGLLHLSARQVKRLNWTMEEEMAGQAPAQLGRVPGRLFSLRYERVVGKDQVILFVYCP